jgi:hypothetical protein
MGVVDQAQPSGVWHAPRAVGVDQWRGAHPVCLRDSVGHTRARNESANEFSSRRGPNT